MFCFMTLRGHRCGVDFLEDFHGERNRTGCSYTNHPTVSFLTLLGQRNDVYNYLIRLQSHFHEGAGAPFLVRGGCHQFPPRRFEGLPDHAELGLQDSGQYQRSTRSHAG